MHSLAARVALADRPDIVTGPYTLRARGDLAAVLVTARTALDLPEAIVRGPHEWLLLGSDAEALLAVAMRAAAGVTALVNDMSDGFAFIELAGTDAFALLGLAPIARAAQGAVTTRIADLRVTVRYAGGTSPSALLVVERSSAEYLWEWLSDRLFLAEKTSVANVARSLLPLGTD
jgi:hypothetical protein